MTTRQRGSRVGSTAASPSACTGLIFDTRREASQPVPTAASTVASAEPNTGIGLSASAKPAGSTPWDVITAFNSAPSPSEATPPSSAEGTAIRQHLAHDDPPAPVAAWRRPPASPPAPGCGRAPRVPAARRRPAAPPAAAAPPRLPSAPRLSCGRSGSPGSPRRRAPRRSRRPARVRRARSAEAETCAPAAGSTTSASARSG